MDKLDFSKVRIFVLFCNNRFTFDDFLVGTGYSDDSYGIEQWLDFGKCHIGYIVSRNEVELFDFINDKIKEIGYKG